jgi:putative inorganic carbon (hco3(-)) transporter
MAVPQRPVATHQLNNAPLYLTGAAAVTIVVSIRAFESLMAVALLALIVTRRQWRFPRVWIPLALFLLGTLVSLVASGHVSQGLPQVRKFYVYLMLFLVTTTFETARQIRWVALGWTLAAVLSSLWALAQFLQKYTAFLESEYRAAGQAHPDFYTFYIDARITGFMGHWMTLGGQLMIVLLLIGSLVFFATDRAWSGWLIAAALPVTAALAATWTRSMWLGAFCGGVYLIWYWKPWTLLVLPVLIAFVLLANPFSLRERAFSAVSPHPGQTDSNAHRAELRRIGWKMIKAHPWLGVGPEQVSRQYRSYIRPDMPTPSSSEYYGHLENDYLQYAAERGVPTTLALLWMIGWALFDFLRVLGRLPPNSAQRWILHAAVAVTIAVLVSGFYSWNLNASEVLAIFLAVMGCGYVAVWEAVSNRV